MILKTLLPSFPRRLTRNAILGGLEILIPILHPLPNNLLTPFDINV